MEERFFSLGGEKSERSNAVVHVSAGRAEDIVATTLRTDSIGASACSIWDDVASETKGCWAHGTGVPSWEWS